MRVDVRGDTKEALDAALKEFKRLVKKEGILQDLRKHEQYVKPSMKAKLKHIEAIKRHKREEREAHESKRTTKFD